MSLRGLLVDYGGVLTTNVFESFRAFSVSRGLEPNAVKELFRSEPRARELVRGLETAALTDEQFSDGFGELLGLDDRSGIVADLFGNTGPDEAMIAAVRSARAQGVRTGMISNSMGSGIYDRVALGRALRRRHDLRRRRHAQAAAGDLPARRRAHRSCRSSSACSSTTCARTAPAPRPSA